MDGRRHSVDIPFSKTLLALRRVRSLRDPSTNSMNKLATLIENLNWDTNSVGEITLGFVNIDEVDVVPKYVKGSTGLNGPRDHNLLNRLGKPNSKLTSHEVSAWVGNTGSVPERTKQNVVSNQCQSNEEVDCQNKSMSGRYCNDYTEKELDSAYVIPASDCLEGVGSCNEPIEGSSQDERLDNNASNLKIQRRKQCREAADDILSCVGSPSLSINDALGGSSLGISLHANEDVDVVDRNHRSCGISFCWSGTPRFGESDYPSDVEDQPLLSGEVGESLSSGKRKSWIHTKNTNVLSLECSRSLSQKFSPRSFGELVGQNVVARSLLTAISTSRISSLYLFHGPRGTGKTSASRIFAAALNCLSLEENRPCGLCRECVLFFSGRSRDVKEVDSMTINRKDKVRSLVRNATNPPVSSRFRVFIIDECHLLRAETWATVLSNIEDLPRHVVFLMITPDLGKLPRSAVSRSHKYHFPKIKEADIARRLEKICMEEGHEFEQSALNFVATQSNGSLRDAEMMLEQLSLLGKRIDMPLVYELIGIVSDDELLDLLDLALSSDNSNTVRRARELMRSGIDPMQLVSQLANLIMDILAGKCQEGCSEVRRKFFSRHTSDASLQQLNDALKILSETEKQLRTAKSQTTWLTVALLQMSSGGCSLYERTVHPKDGDFCSTSSVSEGLKHLVTCACSTNETCKVSMQDDKETLELIWKRAIARCQSESLKKLLRKQGKLSSICFEGGLAVVELEFDEPDYLSKAEKSWKLIANALQSILGCRVEIRINLLHCASMTKYAKMKRPTFSLFSCSRRPRHESLSTTECGSDPPDNYDSTSENAIIKDKYVKTCSFSHGSQLSHHCCLRKEAVSTIRKREGHALSVGMTMSNQLLPDNIPRDALEDDSRTEKWSNCECQAMSALEAEKQPSCFLRSLKLQKKMHSSEQQSNPPLYIPRKPSTDAYLCAKNHQTNCSKDEDGGSRGGAKMHCWRTLMFPFRKTWQLRHGQQRTPLVEWVLLCVAAK